MRSYADIYKTDYFNILAQRKVIDQFRKKIDFTDLQTYLVILPRNSSLVAHTTQN